MQPPTPTDALNALVHDDLLGELPATVPPYRLAAVALRTLAHTTPESNDSTTITRTIETIFEWLRPHSNQFLAKLYIAYLYDIALQHQEHCDYHPRWQELLNDIELELESE